jgi:hypothetical protein
LAAVARLPGDWPSPALTGLPRLNQIEPYQPARRAVIKSRLAAIQARLLLDEAPRVHQVNRYRRERVRFRINLGLSPE